MELRHSRLETQDCEPLGGHKVAVREPHVLPLHVQRVGGPSPASFFGNLEAQAPAGPPRVRAFGVLIGWGGE